MAAYKENTNESKDRYIFRINKGLARYMARYKIIINL